ncbi:MAG: family 16 glycosylhydrolase [Rhizobacter sp.]|nr:family 16 glycosylhydrolase [Chlorobiales bacterium]
MKKIQAFAVAFVMLLGCFQTLVAQIPASGLNLWLKADALALADGDTVSVWPDSSGNALNATASGDRRPRFVANVISGKPALRFDGLDDTMGVALQTGSAVSAFVVASNRRLPDAGGNLPANTVDFVVTTMNSGGNGGFGIATYNSFGYAPNNSTSKGPMRWAPESITGPPSYPGPNLFYKNGTNTPLTLQQNEFAIAAYVSQGITNGTSGSGANGRRMRLGASLNADVSPEADYGANDIAEVIIYNRSLADAERRQVEEYLAAKYAIKLVVFGEKAWKGGEFATKEKYRYGRFEVKMKSARGSGLVSSFFTYHDTANFTSSLWNEIDIEMLGRYESQVQFNTITAGQVSHVIDLIGPFLPHDNFYTYAFEWTPTYVAWFYNGVEVARQTDTGTGQNYSPVSSLSRYQSIMMNIWSSRSASWVGNLDAGRVPAYAMYDYVSYASHTPGTGTAGTGNNFTPQWKDDFDVWDTNRWRKSINGTWYDNVADFIPENVVFKDGYMILCFTTPDSTGYNSTLDAAGEPKLQPQIFSLSQNYPNPFNPATAVNYQLPAASQVQLKVFDVLGREVATLVDAKQAAGNYRVNFNASNLSSGIYFYRLTAGSSDARSGNFTATKKMVLVK